MNRFLQHLVAGFAIVAASAAFAADPPAPRITERQVRDLVEKATRAANARDVPAIVQTLADDAKVVFDFRGPGGKRQRLRMNRDQYEAHAREGMRQMDKYSYKRDKVDISIAPDGQTATVKSQVREVAEYRGNTVVAALDETTTLALRDGKLLVTAVHSVMR
jgi:ketosteroid isomerase-like protein